MMVILAGCGSGPYPLSSPIAQQCNDDKTVCWGPSNPGDPPPTNQIGATSTMVDVCLNGETAAYPVAATISDMKWEGKDFSYFFNYTVYGDKTGWVWVIPTNYDATLNNNGVPALSYSPWDPYFSAGNAQQEMYLVLTDVPFPKPYELVVTTSFKAQLLPGSEETWGCADQPPGSDPVTITIFTPPAP